MGTVPNLSKSKPLARSQWVLRSLQLDPKVADNEQLLQVVETSFLAEGRYNDSTGGIHGCPEDPLEVVGERATLEGDDCGPRSECFTASSEETSTSGQITSNPLLFSQQLVLPAKRSAKPRPSMPALSEEVAVLLFYPRDVDRPVPRVARHCEQFKRMIVQNSLLRCRKNAHPEFLDCIRSAYVRASPVAHQQAVHGWHQRFAEKTGNSRRKPGLHAENWRFTEKPSEERLSASQHLQRTEYNQRLREALTERVRNRARPLYTALTARGRTMGNKRGNFRPIPIIAATADVHMFSSGWP